MGDSKIMVRRKHRSKLQNQDVMTSHDFSHPGEPCHHKKTRKIFNTAYNKENSLKHAK